MTFHCTSVCSHWILTHQGHVRDICISKQSVMLWIMVCCLFSTKLSAYFDLTLQTAIFIHQYLILGCCLQNNFHSPKFDYKMLSIKQCPFRVILNVLTEFLELFQQLTWIEICNILLWSRYLVLVEGKWYFYLIWNKFEKIVRETAFNSLDFHLLSEHVKQLFCVPIKEVIMIVIVIILIIWV